MNHMVANTMPSRSPQFISLPTQTNPLLTTVLDNINHHEYVKTLWEITNVTAINRMMLTDHGILHFQIVSDLGLKMVRLLMEKGVKMAVTTDYHLTPNHAELIVVLASLFHDLGMSIHRVGHEEYSLFVAQPLLLELLVELPIRERTIVTSEVLHAIISHRKDGQPLTPEAGIVRVADALDMSEGRTRFPYRKGKMDIHSVSALAIDRVEVKRGSSKPIRVNITMNHTAGIFQIDELLKKKVTGSGIEAYLDIVVYIDKGKGKKLFKSFLKQ